MTKRPCVPRARQRVGDEIVQRHRIPDRYACRAAATRIGRSCVRGALAVITSARAEAWNCFRPSIMAASLGAPSEPPRMREQKADWMSALLVLSMAPEMELYGSVPLMLFLPHDNEHREQTAAWERCRGARTGPERSAHAGRSGDTR